MHRRPQPLPAETLPRDELEEFRNRRLRSTLREAYSHTLFWHRKFDSLGIKPEDISDNEDLLRAYRRGLLLTDEDLIFDFSSLCPDYLNDSGYVILTTSGTSKKGPKQIPYLDDDFKRNKDLSLFLGNRVGISSGTRNLNAFAPPPNASGVLILIGLRDLGASQYPLMIELPPELELRIIKSYRPQIVWKLGSKALELGNFLRKTGEDVEKLGIETIGIAGEPFSKVLKEKTEKVWNAEVVDLYASAELGPAAFECHGHNGMHVSENRILLNIVDSEAREESEEGQILATVLYDENERPGMFMINKEMGDATKGLGEECECGRRTLKIAPPFRIDDVFPIEAKKFNVRSIEDILYDDNFTGNYVLVKITEKDTGKTKKIQIRTEVKELLPEDRNLISDVSGAFTRSNPLTHWVLKKLEEEGKIEVVYRRRGELYEGLEPYLRRGKPIRFIEVLA